jgi:hypothetical protein
MYLRCAIAEPDAARFKFTRCAFTATRRDLALNRSPITRATTWPRPRAVPAPRLAFNPREETGPAFEAARNTREMNFSGDFPFARERPSFGST